MFLVAAKDLERGTTNGNFRWHSKSTPSSLRRMNYSYQGSRLTVILEDITEGSRGGEVCAGIAPAR